MAVNKPPPKKAPSGPAAANPGAPKAPAPPPAQKAAPAAPAPKAGPPPVATAAAAPKPKPPATGAAPKLPPKAVQPSAGAPAAPAAGAPVLKKSGAPLPKGLGGTEPTRPTRGQAPADSFPVEDRVFGIPGILTPKDAPIFNEFIEKIVPRIDLPYTSRHIIEAFSNIDVKAERVAQILKGNQYYENTIFRIVESLGKRENLGRLEGAVVLVGMQNTRNTVIALQLLRMVKGGHPEWTKEGKLKVNVNEILKYALRTEESLAGNKDSYSDTAYAAGLIFDILALLASEISADKKKILAYIDQVYTHGLKTAQVGAELANSIQDFGFKKYVFSSCLIHDIGKIVLAIINPAYPNFAEDCGKKDLPRQARHFAEAQRFGVNHAILGGLCCEYFHAFQPIQKAILYHHEPYLIKGGMDGLGQLASLICLASNIANNFKKPEKLDDPIIPVWKGVELSGFPIGTREMLDAVSRVG